MPFTELGCRSRCGRKQVSLFLKGVFKVPVRWFLGGDG